MTGLLFLEEDAVDCHDILGTSDTPFNGLEQESLCPGAGKLEANQRKSSLKFSPSTSL